MLPLRTTRLRRCALLVAAGSLSPRNVPHSPASRRFFIQGLSNGFLDLAIALPIPPSLPPYSTTIILVTLVTRFALLPVSIWGKRYTQRIEETVMPEIEKMKPLVAKRVFEEMKSAGVRGDKQFLQQFHAKKTLEVLKARQQQLYKEHKFHPMLPILLPPLSQLPVFVIFTMALGRLSVDPTPFDSESFLTLATLAHPDPTMILPIVLGFITMANVESSHWVMNASERAELRRAEEAKNKRIMAGAKPQIELGKVIKTSLRGLSVFRIIIAAVAPGSITLYWVTSATFGLVQTWITDSMDARRRRRMREAINASSPLTPGKSPLAPLAPRVQQQNKLRR